MTTVVSLSKDGFLIETHLFQQLAKPTDPHTAGSLRKMKTGFESFFRLLDPGHSYHQSRRIGTGKMAPKIGRESSQMEEIAALTRRLLGTNPKTTKTDVNHGDGKRLLPTCRLKALMTSHALQLSSLPRSTSVRPLEQLPGSLQDTHVKFIQYQPGPPSSA